MDVPWSEKYRPATSEAIILDEENALIMQGVISSQRLPHLLLHGPPGTGKTTSAVAIVKQRHGNDVMSLREMVIHLNASDERGISVVREQIESFAQANSICGKRGKIIILDEVDYMTRNAQSSLKVLMERMTTNVSMILICNYIQKIPAGLRSHFIHVRFNAPPVRIVAQLIQDIAQKENAEVSERTAAAIIDAHYPDIRSMINTLQTVTSDTDAHAILKLRFEDGEDLTNVFGKHSTERSLKTVERMVESTGIRARSMIRDYIKHLARNTPDLLTTQFLLSCKVVLRLPAEEEATLVRYFVRVAIPTLDFNHVRSAS